MDNEQKGGDNIIDLVKKFKTVSDFFEDYFLVILLETFESFISNEGKIAFRTG